MAVPNTFIQGTVANPDEVNENFAYVLGIVPVGSTFNFNKYIGLKQSGTNTSVFLNKLIDSSATFITNNVSQNNLIQAYFYSGTVQTHASTNYTLVKTFNINDNNTKGILIRICENKLVEDYDNNRARCKYRFYYTDSTDAYSIENSASNSWVQCYYANPYPSKLVWKVEVYTRLTGAGTGVRIKDDYVYFSEKLKVISINSENELTISEDVFLVTGVNYKIWSVSPPPNEFLECNGSIIDDVESELNGISTPNQNLELSEKTYLVIMRVK